MKKYAMLGLMVCVPVGALAQIPTVDLKNTLVMAEADLPLEPNFQTRLRGEYCTYQVKTRLDDKAVIMDITDATCGDKNVLLTGKYVELHKPLKAGGTMLIPVGITDVEEALK